MIAGTRWLIGATLLCVASPIHPGATAAAQLGGCGTGKRMLRTAAGATLGAWAGLVAMKIRYSDWNDASHTASGIRGRNRGIVVGAVIGASIGNLRFGAPCRQRGLPVTAPRGPTGRSITMEEITEYGTSGTVYDLVFARRRAWLNSRGVELSETPRLVIDERGGANVTAADNPILVVYLDNAKLGDHEMLRQIPMDGVTEVRYYDASQATWRWGAGHNHGAIQVITVTSGGAPMHRVGVGR